MYGSVRFETFPTGANIVIDGMPQNAMTSCIITDIPCGEHIFELQLEDYSSIVGTINVISGVIIDIYAHMFPYNESTGYIEIFSIPEEAIVLIDGYQMDIGTPITISNISPGEHIIKLMKKGYEDCILTVNVEAGKMVLLDIAMTKSLDIGNTFENAFKSIMLISGVIGTIAFTEKSYKRTYI